MSEKIKTSEEIRMELADKKVAKTYLEEFEGGSTGSEHPVGKPCN